MRTGTGPDAGVTGDGVPERNAMTGRPLSVKEAAQRARVSVKTIRRAYTRGHLPFYRPCGAQIVLILDVDVDAWALQPGTPRPRSAPPSPSSTLAVGARRAPGAVRGSPRRHDPGSRDALRAIERSGT